MTEKILIDSNTPLSPGDIIEMSFNVFGSATWDYARAVQLQILLSVIEKKNPNYQLLSYSNREQLHLTFKILGRPVDGEPELQEAGIASAAILAAAVIGVGLFTWLSLDKVEKIVQTPAGKIAVTGVGAVGIAVLVLILMRFFGKSKR